MARHYLDHASISPLRPEARAAMAAQLAPLDDPRRGQTEDPSVPLTDDGADPGGLVPADPSRIHAEGMASRVALEQARQQVADLVGTRSRQVIFTSGATEAIAAAVWGALRRADRSGRSSSPPADAQVVVPTVEHSAVRQASEHFADALGGRVRVVGTDQLGRIDLDQVAAAVGPATVLVHVQWGNHEVGTCQPVAEIVELAHAQGALVHVDAAQAVGHVPVAFDELGADLLSLSGPKFGAPPGTGALLVRRGLRLPPLLVGGDQERARRAGLENVPGLVGLGAVAERLADAGVLAAEQDAARAHTDRLLAACGALDGIEVYGDPVDRLPQLICLGIAGIEPQAVLLGLDQLGIAAHSGSACASEGLEDSPVLEAMGVDAHRSLRLSVGWSTTAADVDALLEALPRVLARLRALGVGA